MPNKFVITGFGLIGIQVLEELFTLGIAPEEITVVDPSNLTLSAEKNNSIETDQIERVYRRNKPNKGLSKQDMSVIELGKINASQTYYWGASCLPPMRFEILRSGYTPESIELAYSAVTKSIGIQATGISKFENMNFPITEEVIDQLPRKQLASKWVTASEGDVYHSRLALSTNLQSGCTFKGTCFEGCPNNAIWNPSSHISNFQSYLARTKFIKGSTSSINKDKRVLRTNKGLELDYDNLIISAGPKESRKLISSIYPKSDFQLKSSPVVLMPFLVKGNAAKEDFKSHFVLVDLLIPFMNENGLGAMTQVYLPTSEIAGRVLLQMPKLMSEVLLQLPSRNLEYLMQHVGIAMIFLPGLDPDVSKSNIKKLIREPIAHLGKVLVKNDAVLLNRIKIYVLESNSHHSGSLFEVNDGSNYSGINSRVYSKLIKEGIQLLDACLLPSIPPGPHTLTAASLARLELATYVQ